MMKAIAKKDRDWGARLREERERIGMTQAEVARKCGVTERTLRNWETSVRPPPITALKDLADLGMDSGYIVFGGGWPQCVWFRTNSQGKT